MADIKSTHSGGVIRVQVPPGDVPQRDRTAVIIDRTGLILSPRKTSNLEQGWVARVAPRAAGSNSAKTRANLEQGQGQAARPRWTAMAKADAPQMNIREAVQCEFEFA